MRATGGGVGVEWGAHTQAQQPMVCLSAAAASRAGVQQTEEKHVCPRGRDWKTGSKSRQGNLHDTHCIKATRLIWKRWKKGKRKRKEVARSRAHPAGQLLSRPLRFSNLPSALCSVLFFCVKKRNSDSTFTSPSPFFFFFLKSISVLIRSALVNNQRHCKKNMPEMDANIQLIPHLIWWREVQKSDVSCMDYHQVKCYNCMDRAL